MAYRKNIKKKKRLNNKKRRKLTAQCGEHLIENLVRYGGENNYIINFLRSGHLIIYPSKSMITWSGIKKAETTKTSQSKILSQDIS